MKLEAKKSNLFFYLISATLLLIVSAICALCKLKWWYYPLGVLLAIITHILMVIQNRRFYRIVNDKYEKDLYSPKKDSFIWYGLRILVIALYLVGMLFLSHIWNNDKRVEIVILFLSGYMSIKVLFIVLILIFKEGR